MIAALRAEAARKSGKPREERAGSASDVRDEVKVSGRDPQQLRREVAELLKGISPNDSDAIDAVRPRVVRAILLWEFGSDFRDHPDWAPMLETLVKTLESSPEHQAQFARMVRDLQG